MGSMSIVHWAIVIGVVVLLFGRGKVSGLMGDFAQGIKSFKRGLREDEPGVLGKVEASRDVLPVDRSVTSTDQKHRERTQNGEN